MARLALATVFVALFLLSSARYIATEGGDALPVISELSDPAAIRLPSDKSSSSSAADESNPKFASLVEVPLPSPDSFPSTEAVPIVVSLIPISDDFPYHRPRRPFWRRLGRHCHHLRHGLHGGIPRGAVIPYGDDMIVSEEHLRRVYGDGRVFPRGSMRKETEEISVEELVKHKELEPPREFRRFPRWRPHGNHEEGDDGLAKRFLDFLNRH